MCVVCCANDWAIRPPSFNLLIWIHAVSTFIFQKGTQLLPLHFVPFIWSGTVSRSQALAHSARRASLMMRLVITTFLHLSGTQLPDTHLPFFTPFVVLALVLGEPYQDPNVAALHQSSIQYKCWSIKLECLWISSYGLLMCCAVTEDFSYWGIFLLRHLPRWTGYLIYCEYNILKEISPLLGEKSHFFLSQQIWTRVGHLWLRRQRQSLKQCLVSQQV